MIINSDTQMFITACCACCTELGCAGALEDTKYRSACKKWAAWSKMTEAERSKSFLKAVAGELDILDVLTNN